MDSGVVIRMSVGSRRKRARSALGLKYLEIQRGTSDEGFTQGATIPLSSYGAVDPDVPGQLEQPVEIDEVLSTFDAPTRVAIQENLVEFGNEPEVEARPRRRRRATSRPSGPPEE